MFGLDVLRLKVELETVSFQDWQMMTIMLSYLLRLTMAQILSQFQIILYR